jgi:hypothetical protein
VSSRNNQSGIHPAGDIRLVKLDKAARRLGCHIETLRLRIRRGQLKAYRGPHGAYFIGIVSLLKLVANSPAVPPAPTETDLIEAWRKARLRARQELGVSEAGDIRPYSRSGRRYSARSRGTYRPARRQLHQPPELQTLVVFLDALQKDPNIHPVAYRLLLGQGLGALGFRAKQIAPVLGVSQRQARRLTQKREIGDAVFRAARRWASREARRLVTELRHQLAVQGFRFHRRSGSVGPPVHPDRPRPAFIVTTLNRDEVMGLKRAGLSDQQIWAITVGGIGSDELNQLLLRGVY